MVRKMEIFGFVAGRTFNEHLELDAELYDDHVIGAQPHEVLLDLGGRYKLSPAFIVRCSWRVAASAERAAANPSSTATSGSKSS
jgi:hypothetical protein